MAALPRLGTPGHRYFFRCGSHDLGYGVIIRGQQLIEQGSERNFASLCNHSVSEKSQFIVSICVQNHPLMNLNQFLVTEAGQFGDAHPSGSPINVSTQRGESRDFGVFPTISTC